MSELVNEMLKKMTLHEKATLTSGTDMWNGHGIERLGIPALKVSDGPAGVRGERWVGTTSACTPCGTALGATWNPTLIGQVGQVLGEEARSKSVDILLAPTVNLHRNPLAGRNFECFSEDPFLTGRAAIAMINGIESVGVGACIKHFVANDSEYQRHTISSQVGERVLRELYLRPFEMVMTETQVCAVMSGYNRLNGTYCAENHWLLQEVLKTEWGFAGLVISDWWGTMSSASAGGGLDLEMPGPPKHLGPTLVDLVSEGTLDEADLDQMVQRILTVSDRLGLFTSPQASGSRRTAEKSQDIPAHRVVLRQAAEQAIVLLKNDQVEGTAVLPLVATSLQRIAVIGPSADTAAVLGGGSAAVNPHYSVSVLQGLETALGDKVRITHHAAVRGARSAPPIDSRCLRSANQPELPGLDVEYFSNLEFAGTPACTEHAAQPRLVWMGAEAAPGVATNCLSVRVSGTFIARSSGTHTFALVTGGTGGRVMLNEEVILDNYTGQEPGTAFFGLGSSEIRAEVQLRAGEERRILGEFTGYEGVDAGAFLIGHLEPVPEDGIEQAAQAAAESDVAIVVVGLDQDSETEGEDRSTLSLPGEQDALLRAVIAANPRTVVLVNAGSVVDLDAAQGAAAIAQTWYLGQETGNAVAAVLTGQVDAAGRLPTTYGKQVQDWSSHLNYPGQFGEVLYGEELFMGYRGFDKQRIEPAFCFGHGLSYATFSYSEATLSDSELTLGELLEGAEFTVSAQVTNTSERAGFQVIQCYINRSQNQVGRPEQELCGFIKLHLTPGESALAQIPLDFRSCAVWDQPSKNWVTHPGHYEFRLGTSSRSIFSKAVLQITE
ncbi:MAG: glycoside hydrolase family 3 C-terminal domain-containing protein [Microthrixaceae bacterium]